jgi:hypothetical protein
MLKFPCKKLTALALTLGLSQASSAFAVINVTDSFKDGSFANTDITYGDGSGEAFISPLLFATDFGNTQPAKTQVTGAGIDYSYSFSGSGTSTVELDYTFTSTRKSTDAFPNVSGLRFMLDAIAYGSNAFVTTDQASQSWPAAIAGDPDKRQIQDLNIGALKSLLISNNGIGINDGANNCAPAGCTTNFGLEWDLATLAPGQTWNIKVKLVDDPALVNGGRFLRADSVDVVGNTLVVGNPTLVPEPITWMMLLVGFALLWMVRGVGRADRVLAFESVRIERADRSDQPG